MPIRLPLHLASRDAIRAERTAEPTAEPTAERKGAAAAAATSAAQPRAPTPAELYRRVVVGNDAGEHGVLAAWGLLAHVNFPRRVLAGDLTESGGASSG